MKILKSGNILSQVFNIMNEKHNFLLYGGVDDIMIDEEDKLVVIDFKATAKKQIFYHLQTCIIMGSHTKDN